MFKAAVCSSRTSIPRRRRVSKASQHRRRICWLTPREQDAHEESYERRTYSRKTFHGRAPSLLSYQTTRRKRRSRDNTCLVVGRPHHASALVVPPTYSITRAVCPQSSRVTSPMRTRTPPSPLREDTPLFRTAVVLAWACEHKCDIHPCSFEDEQRAAVLPRDARASS